MGAKKTSETCSPEMRERTVWMILVHQHEHESQWVAICSTAAKIGRRRETLRNWVWQVERDQGSRPGATTEERERMRAVERENRERRQTKEILRKASAYVVPLGHCFAITERAAGGSATARSSDVRAHRRSSQRLRDRPMRLVPQKSFLPRENLEARKRRSGRPSRRSNDRRRFLSRTPRVLTAASASHVRREIRSRSPSAMSAMMPTVRSFAAGMPHPERPHHGLRDRDRDRALAFAHRHLTVRLVEDDRLQAFGLRARCDRFDD